MEYRIEELTSNEKDTVYEFTRRWFFSSEPVTMSWSEIPPKDAVSYVRALDHGMSIKATDVTGDIAAICINGDSNQLESSAPPTIPDNLRKLYNFFSMVESEAGEDNSLMSVLIVCVTEKHRRQGLCSRLLNASLSVAKKHGYRGARILCTSHHSASAAVKAGWNCLLSSPYTKYEDSENFCGLPLYSPPHPHTHVSVYQKIL